MGKVLIVADQDDKKYFATPRGLELAGKLGYGVDVVAFVYAPLSRLKIRASEQAAIKKRLLAERSEQVQARIDKYSVAGQKVALKVVWEKDIARWVKTRCSNHGYEAVVKTGHRTESPVYTPTDWQLLRTCPAPVLLVCDRKWHKTKPVLAAVDLSSQSRAKLKLNHKIVATAMRIASALEAELKIIAAIEIPTLLADMDLVDPAQYAREAKEAMQPHIRALALAHDLPERVFRAKRGPAEKVIISDAAAVKAQLVVMGTVGRTGVKARLMGNTAERVLSHLHTDVLTLKP
jgi:universal stress protein E